MALYKKIKELKSFEVHFTAPKIDKYTSICVYLNVEQIGRRGKKAFYFHIVPKQIYM
jgi:hypothetical protein